MKKGTDMKRSKSPHRRNPPHHIPIHRGCLWSGGKKKCLINNTFYIKISEPLHIITDNKYIPNVTNILDSKRKLMKYRSSITLINAVCRYSIIQNSFHHIITVAPIQRKLMLHTITRHIRDENIFLKENCFHNLNYYPYTRYPKLKCLWLTCLHYWRINEECVHIIGDEIRSKQEPQHRSKGHHGVDNTYVRVVSGDIITITTLSIVFCIISK